MKTSLAKKTLAVLVVLSQIIMANAEVLSWECGANGSELICLLDMETGTMIIEGSGEMADWSTKGDAPWYEYRNLIKSIYIPESVTSIGVWAFVDCKNLKKLTIADSTTPLTIANCEYTPTNRNLWTFYQSFLDSPIETLYLGRNINYTCDNNGVKGDDYYYVNKMQAFGYKLEHVTISNTVKSVPAYIFYSCGLTSVYNHSASPQGFTYPMGSYFPSIDIITGGTLYVPEGSEQLYKTANGWKNFNQVMTFTSAVQDISIPEITVYPNPATENIHLSGISGKTNIILVDINGRIVLSQTVEEDEAISVSHLSAGIYFLYMEIGKKIISFKIIKL